MSEPGLPAGVVLLGRDPDGLARVRVEPRSPLLDGHFPERPVLPGVALLGVVEALCGRRVVGVERVKLLAPIEPGLTLNVTLRAAGRGRLELGVRATDGAPRAAGIVIVEEEEGEQQ